MWHCEIFLASPVHLACQWSWHWSGRRWRALHASKPSHVSAPLIVTDLKCGAMLRFSSHWDSDWTGSVNPSSVFMCIFGFLNKCLSMGTKQKRHCCSCFVFLLCVDGKLSKCTKFCWQEVILVRAAAWMWGYLLHFTVDVWKVLLSTAADNESALQDWQSECVGVKRETQHSHVHLPALNLKCCFSGLRRMITRLSASLKSHL